jgi:hypothetical protein
MTTPIPSSELSTTPGVVDDALIAQIAAFKDKPVETDLGVVTALTISRYARACSETDPVFYDAEAARLRGYRDVLAPLNMLPSIVDWTVGAPVEDLREDGTGIDESAVGLPAGGYRIMGGGERMEFFDRLVAGDRVLVSSRMSGVELRNTSKGAMAIIRYRNDYKTDAGVLLMACERSILVRNGVAA